MTNLLFGNMVLLIIISVFLLAGILDFLTQIVSPIPRLVIEKSFYQNNKNTE